jgi:hypothetical protein
METPALQPQTLTALIELVRQWNQDPLAQHNGLVITGSYVTITNGSETLLSLQFPTESIEQNQNHSRETEPEDEPEIDHDEVTFTLEPSNPTEVNNADPELTSKDTVAAMIQDLNEEQLSTPFRAEPLLTFIWKDQATEISNRFNQEIRGSQREKQVRTLETCYYLGQLLDKFQHDSKVLKEMKNLFNSSLGKRRAYNLWKGAKRTYQLFQHRDPSLLYRTQYISLNNLTRLTTNNFEKLLDPGTHGVRS